MLEKVNTELTNLVVHLESELSRYRDNNGDLSGEGFKDEASLQNKI